MAKEAPDAGLISILWKIFNLCKGRWLTLLVKFPSNFAGLAGVSPSVLPSMIDLERCNIKTLGRSRSLLLLILTVTLIKVLSNNYWIHFWGGGVLFPSHFIFVQTTYMGRTLARVRNNWNKNNKETFVRFSFANANTEYETWPNKYTQLQCRPICLIWYISPKIMHYHSNQSSNCKEKNAVTWW